MESLDLGDCDSSLSNRLWMDLSAMKINSSVTLTQYPCHHITLGLDTKTVVSSGRLQLTAKIYIDT